MEGENDMNWREVKTLQEAVTPITLAIIGAVVFMAVILIVVAILT